MINDIKVNVSSLENEKAFFIATYKKLLDEFAQLKKLVEGVQWYDEQYDTLIDELNIIASTLSNGIHRLTNGHNVRVIDEVIYSAEMYLENERAFPKI